MSPGQTEFSVSYDRTTRIVSAVVCVFLVLAAIAAHSIWIGGLLVLTLVLGYAYSPRGYTVSDQAITVTRLTGNARFPLERIREARQTTADDLRGCIRLWGSGGFFGYYGLFRTSKFGLCRWYVTNRRNTVVAIAGAKTALFSPDDVDGFLAAVGTAAPSPGTSAEPFDGPGVRIPARAWAGIAIAALAMAVAALAFLYSPGPPSYTLTTDALAIHDRFYPVTLKAAEVDVANIRLVDVAVDREWRPTLRVNGFANSHYRAGWFRTANGQRVRVYRARATRLVLLPPKGNGAPVLLEAREPERFVDEVRRAWQSS
jgi:hypothetical protein